jgi:hypothetical protein
MKNNSCFGCPGLSSRAVPEVSRTVARPTGERSRRDTAGSALGSVAALLLLASYGCASKGSDFESTGGSTVPPSGSGGATNIPGSGGSGLTGIGTGGSIGGGATGGSVGSGGGPSVGTGGSVATGSGGMGVGTGGRTSTGGSVGTGGSAVVGTGGAGPACPKPAGQLCHEFLANDNRRNVVNYVNEFDPTKNWTRNVGDTTENSPRTIEIVSNPLAQSGKAILVSVDKGYAELDLIDGTRLAFVQGYTSITGACRLPDGTTALGNLNQIVIVSATGTRIRNIPIPAGANLRAINRDPETGDYWFSKDALLYDVDGQTGQVKWMANMGAATKGYAVWWRVVNGVKGGAYATTGDPSTVIEIDAAGQIIKTTGGKGATFPFLDFFSGFVRLTNGDYVVANWLGHLTAPAANAPEVLQFNAANQIVWQWGNQTLAAVITNVFVLR